MKLRIATLSLLFSVAGFISTSCDKYEDGPEFTVLTEKMRISRDWRLTERTVNGSSDMSSIETVDVTFGKNGSYKKVKVTTVNGNSVTDSDTGSWDFNSDKTKLIITDGDGNTKTYTILELRNSDLKYRLVGGDDVKEWKYIAN
jgi:hypothetical protein